MKSCAKLMKLLFKVFSARIVDEYVAMSGPTSIKDGFNWVCSVLLMLFVTHEQFFEFRSDLGWVQK